MKNLLQNQLVRKIWNLCESIRSRERVDSCLFKSWSSGVGWGHNWGWMFSKELIQTKKRIFLNKTFSIKLSRCSILIIWSWFDQRYGFCCSGEQCVPWLYPWVRISGNTKGRNLIISLHYDCSYQKEPDIWTYCGACEEQPVHGFIIYFIKLGTQLLQGIKRTS